MDGLVLLSLWRGGERTANSPRVKTSCVSLRTARRQTISNRGYYYLSHDIKMPTAETRSQKCSRGKLIHGEEAHSGTPADTLHSQQPSPWAPGLTMLLFFALLIRLLQLSLPAVVNYWFDDVLLPCISLCYSHYICSFTFAAIYLINSFKIKSLPIVVYAPDHTEQHYIPNIKNI